MEIQGKLDGSGKRSTRKEVLERKKTVDNIIKVASSVKDHLSCFPSFRYYTKNGFHAHLESGSGNKLSFYTKKYIQTLLKLNMEVPYGPEWPAEEKIKRREMVAEEARYIFVREISSNDGHEVVQLNGQESTCSCQGPIVGFVHYRFILEEEVPVVYIYELQLEPHVQGKGLGKFLMELMELIARKNGLSAVVLTVQKANQLAMDFYIGKLRYKVSAISPSRIDPLLGPEKSYEILCKTFDHEAQAILEGGSILLGAQVNIQPLKLSSWASQETAAYT